MHYLIIKHSSDTPNYVVSWSQVQSKTTSLILLVINKKNNPFLYGIMNI